MYVKRFVARCFFSAIINFLRRLKRYGRSMLPWGFDVVWVGKIRICPWAEHQQVCLPACLPARITHTAPHVCCGHKSRYRQRAMWQASRKPQLQCDAQTQLGRSRRSKRRVVGRCSMNVARGLLPLNMNLQPQRLLINFSLVIPRSALKI